MSRADDLRRRGEALDGLDLGELEDFESEDLEEASDSSDPARNEYIGQMWARYGFTESTERRDMSAALVTALKMCQTIVDTFAGDGRAYRVTFDPTVSTAGTDLIGQKVIITPSPVYDKTISPQQAGVILTAMSTHEASHDRYGRGTALAVRRTFGNKRSPSMLSNVLDDVRIERRFAAEYPGYRDIFRPMIDYVATKATAGLPPHVPSMTDLVNLAVAAVRFPTYTSWRTQELKDERDWWQGWAERGSREDAPRRHVEAVREGLRHVLAAQIARERRKPPSNVLLTVDVGRVKARLDTLSPLAQKAMRLTSEGRTGLEIAATLGLSVDDARVLVRSARKHIAGLS